MERAASTNQAIAQAGAEGLDAKAAPSSDEARFALAVALAASGRYEPALNAYKALIHGDRDDLKRAALYNLGNLHLREAQRRDPSDRLKALPLIELAKQSYRDLLRLDPSDWNARYNLERALWLAPEAEDSAQEPVPPQQSERAVTTMRSDRGELP